MSTSTRTDLTRFAWLAIAASISTIILKLGAFWLTNSVGLLSDAIESGVNLVAAIVALVALTIAARPANDDFSYGYSKAEFFASGFEGSMILIAAGSIAFTAIPRLVNPQPLEQVGLGLGVSAVAGVINLVVSRILFRAGKQYNSITLEADARHLMTDVLTTAGVILGVALVELTGWVRLDPIIALLVAVNIVVTGVGLVRRSALGLMDASLPAADIKEVQDALKIFEPQGVKFHALRTRSAAARGFVSMHILVPGKWSIQRGHHLAEEIESEIVRRLPNVHVITHVEPLEDPASWTDTNLDRE
ncbi:MAG: cation diffusion facilitator family transporter [Anaerolineales bacterium]|jgi:cation diffusion facilitator family transporter